MLSACGTGLLGTWGLESVGCGTAIKVDLGVSVAVRTGFNVGDGVVAVCGVGVEVGVGVGVDVDVGDAVPTKAVEMIDCPDWVNNRKIIAPIRTIAAIKPKMPFTEIGASCLEFSCLRRLAICPVVSSIR